MRLALRWMRTKAWKQSCTKTGVLVALLIATFLMAHELDFREQCGSDPACAAQHLEEP